MRLMRIKTRVATAVAAVSIGIAVGSMQIAAQSTAFSYQGSLMNNGAPANGSYDFEFLLFSAANGGSQSGNALARNGVQVANGSFTVYLDFGSQFPGQARFLEIRVRPAGSPGFTILAPRQPINSAPYAIRSLTAASADSVPVGGVPGGSGNYIQNSTLQQPSSDFSISGNGTAGGTLSANIVNAATVYRLNGNHMLSNPGDYNLLVGLNAGGSANTGVANAFVGHVAGLVNTSGSNNAFFGSFAGLANTTASDNSFFGSSAGKENTGDANSFFGSSSGISNTTGADNSFFGRAAGLQNTTGKRNSFFGSTAGISNSTGEENSFFGYQAGLVSNGFYNSFFGAFSGLANTTGQYNSFFGTRAGSKNTTGSYNSVFGAFAGVQNTTGGNNTFFGYTAGYSNTNGNYNAFVGTEAGSQNTSGDANTFLGFRAGDSNSTASANTFVGYLAGWSTDIGPGNAFFGYNAGDSNSSGSNNTVIGTGADVGASNLSYATALGADSIVTSSNTIALGRGDGSDKLVAYGRARIGIIPLEASAAQVCFNAQGDLLQCGASSLRWKTDIRPLELGLKTILALRPLRYSWKESGSPDIGLGAEDVAETATDLAILGPDGSASGVRYDRLPVVIINAIREQQEQIETQRRIIKRQEASMASQQAEIDALKRFICRIDGTAEFCSRREN